MSIKLGDKVRDIISGFEGIATGRSIYLYGCERILVEPDRLDENGKMVEGNWIDEQRIELAESRVIPMTSQKVAATAGGPQKDPPKH